ncbi:DUF6445 family protein [Lysobacter capsici]|uniref:DUF6445 family protein n=1 Tax=Lysobacter capsici TaxID=435897 RepID=UPI001C002500|nr:DUF6445 family protein [Lysobacter capsici]QWF19299.1 hypothetical protein KME82_11440 [Lysobacter capsici]
MIVIDDFLPDGAGARALALGAPYQDVLAPDGEVYRRVCVTEVPGLVPALEAAVGPVEMLLSGFRLNFAGEMPNAAIHSDIGFGTHALVLYLCDGEGGTAFWTHKATGEHRIEPGDVPLWHAVCGDWDRPEAWSQRELAELKFNRAVIYESALFHSRFPFAAFGTGPQDGRLIAVAFFNLRGT